VSAQRSSLRLVALRAALSLVAVLLGLVLAELAFRLLTHDGQLFDTTQVEFWQAHLRTQLAAGAGPAANIVYDPQLGWRMKPSFRSEDGGGVVTQNSRGFRGPEEFAEQPGARLRVFVVGASMAYGLGVPDDEVFTARLEKKYGVEAIDAGVNAYGTDQTLLLFEQEGRRYRPQVVVLVAHVDDFFRVGLPIRDLPKPYFVERDGGFELAGVPVPSVEALASRGALAPPGTLRIVEAWRWLARRAAWRAGHPDPAEMERLRRLERYVMGRLRDSAEAGGARFLMVIAGHCAPDPSFRYSGPALHEIGTELGIETLDTRDAFADPRGGFYGANCHWSSRAHEQIADDLAQALALAPLR